MTNQDMINLILGDSARVTTAISTGAAWEIWMQVELIILLRQASIGAAREVPYPSPYDRLSLDTLAQDSKGGRYAIELKVESANNAGTFLYSVSKDVAKLQFYQAPNLTARWVVAMAYSSPAKTSLQNYANVQKNNALYGTNGAIGVLVIAV